MNCRSFSKIWVVVVVIALVAVAGLTYQYLKNPEKSKFPAKETVKAETADWDTYQNDLLGYSFKYPANQFEIEESKDIEGESVTYIKAISISVFPDIRINVVSLDKGEHLKKSIIWTYGAAASGTSSSIIDCESAKKNVETEDVLLNEDIEAIKIYNKNGVVDWSNLYWYTFFFIKKDKAFTVTLIRPENYSDEYIPLFYKIISTFEFYESN